jgi:hypothetical protein
MDHATIAALKVLTDATRLRIAGRLAASPATTEELVGELGLPTAVVIRQLGLMRRAGLLGPTAPWSLRLDALQTLGRSLDELERAAEASVPPLAGPDGQPLPANDAKVLRGYLEDGRLTTIPASNRKRRVVLDWLRDQVFTEDRGYEEKEVNQRLALFHPDVASLRRYMVDEGLVTRENGIYHRAG